MFRAFRIDHRIVARAADGHPNGGRTGPDQTGPEYDIHKDELFSGYSIQMRGIGTQAISVTTDPAVAVAFNDIPFIRNHFFEQEFYDVARWRCCADRKARFMGAMLQRAWST